VLTLSDVVVIAVVAGVVIRYLSEGIALLVLVPVAAKCEGRRAARAERLIGVLLRRSSGRR